MAAGPVQLNIFAWNQKLKTYVKDRQPEKAMQLFQQMQQEVVALKEGSSVHDQIIQSALESAVFVGNSLVNTYAKCGSIGDAWRVFNKMPS